MDAVVKTTRVYLQECFYFISTFPLPGSPPCSLRIFLEVSHYVLYDNYNKLRIFLESQVLCPVALTLGSVEGAFTMCIVGFNPLFSY